MVSAFSFITIQKSGLVTKEKYLTLSKQRLFLYTFFAYTVKNKCIIVNLSFGYLLRAVAKRVIMCQKNINDPSASLA